MHGQDKQQKQAKGKAVDASAEDSPVSASSTDLFSVLCTSELYDLPEISTVSPKICQKNDFSHMYLFSLPVSPWLQSSTNYSNRNWRALINPLFLLTPHILLVGKNLFIFTLK